MFAPWTQTEETPKEQPQQNEPQNINQKALAICNKVESDNVKKLRLWYDTTGSAAALKELTRYEEILKETCLKRAKDNGYWDPIGEVEKVWKGIFGGGDDQSSNFKQPDSPDGWAPGFPADQRPTPDGKPYKPEIA